MLLDSWTVRPGQGRLDGWDPLHLHFSGKQQRLSLAPVCDFLVLPWRLPKGTRGSSIIFNQPGALHEPLRGLSAALPYPQRRARKRAIGSDADRP